MEHIDTIVVGGGQAGLAISYYLTQQGREHIVLEQAARPAPVWRNERWDSFTLVTPNWSLQIPGAEHDGADRDGFMPRDEVIAYFDQYVARFRLPVQTNTHVESVMPLDGPGYRVTTPERTIAATNVVMATGFFQHPKIPSFAAALSPGFTQLHSSQYRNPQSLPPGGVLVAGSAQSGCQIAEELNQRGRGVFLATGTAGRVPRRYRGQDIIAWLVQSGFIDLTPSNCRPACRSSRAFRTSRGRRAATRSTCISSPMTASPCWDTCAEWRAPRPRSRRICTRTWHRRPVRTGRVGHDR